MPMEIVHLIPYQPQVLSQLVLNTKLQLKMVHLAILVDITLYYNTMEPKPGEYSNSTLTVLIE